MWIIAISATGIAVGAILVGAREWRMPANLRWLLFLATGAAASFVLSVTAGSLWVLLAAVFAGLFVSPVMVTAITLVAARAPRDRLTESLAYPTAGMSIGVPIGGTLSGIALDVQGPAAGFLVCALSLVAALVVGVAGEGWRVFRSRQRAAALPADRPAA